MFQAPPTIAGGSWSASELYSFQGPSADGEGGAGPLRFDKNGNLFGASQTGGNVACGSFTSPVGCGTIFQLTPPVQSGGAWTETVLYKFQGIGDGDAPIGRMVIDAQGKLYGVTLSDGPMNAGVVFELRPPAQSGGIWTETVLHAFGASSGDGLIPSSGLVRDIERNFFGLARAGGNTACNNYFVSGCGVVYRLSPPKQKGAGWTETVIYAFTGGSDGQSPQGELAIDAGGEPVRDDDYGNTE